MQITNWEQLSVDEVFTELEVSNAGLTTEESEERLKKYGKNILPQEKSPSSFTIFLSQFKSPLIYILFLAGLVTLIMSDYTDTIVIFFAVLLNSLVGFFQENKASNALESLKKVLKSKARVIRDGKRQELFFEEIVPGDIIFLKSGDKVPADARVYEAENLRVNEASLTGEWMAVEKNNQIIEKDVTLADRKNMVYMGTFVESGNATALVTSTGINTEVGKIAQLLLKTKEKKTPYQKKLISFGRVIAILVIILSVLIFVLGLIKGESFIDIFTTSVALAVAAIPEGLPIAMTVVLALGMQRILKRNGLLRKLSAAESLGSTTVICVDKTGTLTEGKMEVDQSSLPSPDALKIAALCSEAYIENPDESSEKWVISGRPTDRALMKAALETKIPLGDYKKNIIDRLEFVSENKISACLVKTGGETVFYLLGAPEKVLKFCATEQKYSELEQEFHRLTNQGMRVLAAAEKKTTKEKIDLNDKELFSELSFAGFISLKDPLRDEVKDAIKIARQAGLRPIMLTGDHKFTAKKIAEALGFRTENENIIEGEELAELSSEEFKNRISAIDVYARLEPAQKLKIVEAFQSSGEVVAMTGDGVNDAPALKKADIGLALGSGSQVSHEVSDIVLLDDNFSTIVSAIEEGRAIIDNIRKSIVYLIADSFTEILLIIFTILLGWPLPVIAAQILWINLIEGGLPTIALAFEEKEPDLMQRKPNPKNLPLLTRQMISLIVVVTIVSVGTLLGLYFYLLNYTSYDIGHIRTVIFAGLALATLFYVFSCKTLKKNIWEINLFTNVWLIFAFLAGLFLLFLAIYSPALHVLLKTQNLMFMDWILVLILSFINIIFIETSKFFTKKL